MSKTAEVIHEHGPFPQVKEINGVTYDGRHVWLATGDRLQAIDPDTGAPGRAVAAACPAGTAFDGKAFYQIDGNEIRKIDPQTGKVLATLPTPDGDGHSGLAWAEGMLWVAHFRHRKIYQVDPGTGKVLNTLESNRYVTGVTWVGGELWHATWEDDASELRRVDPRTGKVLASAAMPQGMYVSGLESDGADRLFCGGAESGMLRVVRRPGS